MILAEAYSPRRIADLLIWISFGSPGSLFAMQRNELNWSFHRLSVPTT
jgi:hypothetical protein